MSEKILEILASNLPIDKQDVYRIRGSIGLGRLMEFVCIDRPDLKDKPFLPSTPPCLAADADEDMFSAIRREDLLLHHPYESFQPIVEFLQQAARDPNVLAIKVTLYRVGRNLPIVAALLEAVEQGKQVSVLVELKARFDEESNIEWARTLEDSGVHVVYGLVGLKVHSKVALVVRREGEVIRRYVHLGTGNYNPTTARIYTDFGFLTCDEKLADDVTYFFNSLTGYSRKNEPHELLVAPVNLRQRLEKMILREIALQEKGERGHLIFKMNALEDPQMIKLLYRASQAGVKVELLVAASAACDPWLADSATISALPVSSAVFWSTAGSTISETAATRRFISAAPTYAPQLESSRRDLVSRRNNKLVRRLKDILTLQFSDEKKSHHLQSDGNYIRNSKREQPDAVDCQLRLLSHEDSPLKTAKGSAALSRKGRVADRRAHERPKA